MSGPRIQITNPKLLTEEDFASLRGTSLYEQLFRNRCSLSILNRSSSAQKVAENEVVEWLKDNCHTFYYFDSETGYVFIEGDADVLNFKMKFDDHDVVIPDPPKQPTHKSDGHKTYHYDFDDLEEDYHEIVDYCSGVIRYK